MKKNVKIIIGLLISFLIGISTTVGATAVFNSKDIIYKSDATDKINVKDSLDELYTKASKIGKCPNGYNCIDLKLISSVNIGDYIKIIPSQKTYTISKDLTGYTSDQVINPSELNIWRVISKNADGTVDVVSSYVSSKSVFFRGQTGYMNLIGGLNTIANQYTNEKYIQSTRHTGYSNQIKNCISTSLTDCPIDTDYEKDINLIKNAIGTEGAKFPNSTNPCDYYYLSSRHASGKWTIFLYARSICNSVLSTVQLYDGGDKSNSAYIRPILTIKSDVKIVSGDGKSELTAYAFE